MKNSIIFYLSMIILTSCNNLEIITENETKITTEPVFIDKSNYEFLKDTFNLTQIGTEDAFYLGGLFPQYNIAIGYRNDQMFNEPNCLYRQGCLNSTGVFLIVEKEGGFYFIDSHEKLKDVFGPIDSKEEAISFAHLKDGSYPQYDFDIEDGYKVKVKKIETTHVDKTDNGYEVNLFDYALCGCGPHYYFMRNYKVSPEGDIEGLDIVNLYRDPSEDGLCVD